MIARWKENQYMMHQALREIGMLCVRARHATPWNQAQSQVITITWSFVTVLNFVSHLILPNKILSSTFW